MSLEQELLQLRDMTERFEVLHEAQRVQLVNWGLVVLDHIEKSEDMGLEVGFENHLVEYEVKRANMKKRPVALRDRCSQLTDWVRWLLGDKWNVRVKQGRKILFNSKVS